MRPLPQRVVAGLTTKSAQILALAEAGFERTEIATFLKIRYQHVRNVLIQKGFQGGLAGMRKESVQLEQSILAIEQSSDKLLTAGFKRLGACRLLSGDNFELDAVAPMSPGVYAFVVEGVIRHIGLTKGTLRTRLGHYVYGHSGQKTNARVKGLILASLAADQKVEVLIASPEEGDWNGLPVDVAAGLESGLIKLLRPSWNIQGVR